MAPPEHLPSPSQGLPRAPVPRAWTVAGAALALAHFGLLVATLDIGFPRDEGFYFSAAEQYSRWLDDLFEDPARAFTRETVERRFAANPEHPALPKFLFGVSWRLFGRMNQDPSSRFWYDGGRPPEPILGWLDEATAMRLPALLLASLLVYLVFRFGAVFFNPRAGLAAAVAWAFMPHPFWHSHLACFDVPVTAMWFLTAYCYLRAESGGWRWAVATGVAWGLALSTKHNAFFLPVVLVLHFLGTRTREFRLQRGTDGRTELRLPSIPASWLAMLLISPLIYYALWPKLWFDPVGHLKWYFARHAEHEYYWAYYFGTLYTKPPFPVAFPFVMSLVTIPAPTTLLAVIGLARLVLARFSRASRDKTRIEGLRAETPRAGTLWFVFLNFLIPFAVIAHPKVPIFGGTKHWMHGVPYLALFAGVGFDWVCREVGAVLSRRGWRPRAIAAAVATTCALVAAPLVLDTLRGHTNGSTYYQAFFGGFGAMGEHRMQREFWGNTAFSALEYLNREAPPGARVDFHDTAWDSVRMYRRMGMLRPDIVPVWDYKQADFFLFHWHKEFLDLEAEVRREFGVSVPAYVVAQDGVPLLNVYRRASRSAGARPLRDDGGAP